MESGLKAPDHVALRDVHLHEYSALSSAIADATKRIETIRGLYLAAAFAAIGTTVSKQPSGISVVISRVSADQYILMLVLLLPFLNSLLLIYVASLMHFILAAAKYNTYSLRPSIEKIVGGRALEFDRWSCNDKSAWLFLRTAVGILFYALSTWISIWILLCFRAAGQFKMGAGPASVFVLSVASVAFSVTVGMASLFISRSFHKSKEPKLLQPRFVYWVAVPLAIALYIGLAN